LRRSRRQNQRPAASLQALPVRRYCDHVRVEGLAVAPGASRSRHANYVSGCLVPAPRRKQGKCRERVAHLPVARSESQIVRLSDPAPLVPREFGDGSRSPEGYFRDVAFSEVSRRCGFENAQRRASEEEEFASENAKGAPRVRRGRLPVEFAGVLDSYVVALASAPLSEQTRRTYASKVRQYLAWLAGGELEGDPLGTAAGRD
jgi:hypothetical protein